MPLLYPYVRELTEKYRWKAEHIVRFFEKLNMSTKEKEDFLARELATAYWTGEVNATGSDI